MRLLKCDCSDGSKGLIQVSQVSHQGRQQNYVSKMAEENVDVFVSANL